MPRFLSRLTAVTRFRVAQPAATAAAVGKAKPASVEMRARVATRLRELRSMSDAGVYRSFDEALKTRLSTRGFAWGKDPASGLRTAADYVRDVVHNQGRELADSVRQVRRSHEAMALFFEDIAARSFSVQAVSELDAWLHTGPVLVEFQKRVRARPQVFVELARTR